LHNGRRDIPDAAVRMRAGQIGDELHQITPVSFFSVRRIFAAAVEVLEEYSAHTEKAYRCDLMQFVAYLSGTHPDRGVRDVTPAVVQLYKETIAERKPATVTRKLSALSTFFDWLWIRGEVEANPVSAVKRPRKRHEETKWVTPEDSIALLAACRNDRERAILATYIRAALRYSELMHIQLSDVDLVRDEMSVAGKGNIRRALPILSDLRPYLVRWLAARPEVDHDYVFTTRTGHPLYQKACWRLFRSLLKRAGLEHKGYTVHSLRHGAATQMYEAGVDTPTIARFLRHSDMSTVARYIHLGTATVRRELEEKLGSTLPLPTAGGRVSQDQTIEIVLGNAIAEALLRLIHHPSIVP